MNPDRIPVPPVATAHGPRRVFRAVPAALGVPTRASLPVVSNRAFISAWTARRHQLAALAQAHRSN